MVLPNNKRILIHACCGICSGYPLKYLKENGYNSVVYFCNPNLDTIEEFERRLTAQRTVCKYFDADLIVEPYEHSKFLECIKGLENEPEKGLRCDKCIELRLKYTAEKSKELGIDLFTTSLVISPHKNFDKISEIGLKLAKSNKVQYLPQNFRKNDGFLKTNNISKELDLYRQNYCGCEFAKHN